MSNKTLPAILAIQISIVFTATPLQAHERKTIAGYIETVSIYPPSLTLHAKLDTGARTSSLNAQNMETYLKNGETWIRFTITNRENEKFTYEKRTKHYVAIKRHFSKQQRRPVIELQICLDGILKETEVNLVDRSGFDYQILIGRSFLSGDFLIDAGEKYLTSPKCQLPAETP